MSYREWWTFAEIKHAAWIESAGKYDQDKAADLEQHLRDMGVIT